MALGGPGPRESLMSQWTFSTTRRRLSQRFFPRRSQVSEQVTGVASALRSSSFIGLSVGSPTVTSHSHEHGPWTSPHHDPDSVRDGATTAVGDDADRTAEENLVPERAVNGISPSRTSSLIGNSVGTPIAMDQAPHSRALSSQHEPETVHDEGTTAVGDAADEYQVSEQATNVASGPRASDINEIPAGVPIPVDRRLVDGQAPSSHSERNRMHDETMTGARENPGHTTGEQDPDGPSPKVQFQPPNKNVAESEVATAKARKMAPQRLKKKAMQRINLWLQRVRRLTGVRTRRRSRSKVPEIVQPQPVVSNSPKYCEHCTARHKQIRDGRTKLARDRTPCNCSVDCLCRRGRDVNSSDVPSHILRNFLGEYRTPHQDGELPPDTDFPDHGDASGRIEQDVAHSGAWANQDGVRGEPEINGDMSTEAQGSESAQSSAPLDIHEGAPMFMVNRNGGLGQEDDGDDSAIDMTNPGG